MSERVDSIAKDYCSVGIFPATCSTGCNVCDGPPAVRSIALDGFQWCLPHFIELIIERADHERAKAEHPDEVTFLLAHIHAIYHHVADATAAMEAVSTRFPECADLPLADVVSQR